MEQPTVVVGAGLAGMCTALALAGRVPVLLADAGTPEDASRAAVAGLANPLMSQRGNPVWKVDAALDALDRLISRLNLAPSHTGLLRPAATWKQVDLFRGRAEQRPDLASWLPAAVSAERYPWLSAPMGIMEILRGGAYDLPGILDAAHQMLGELGCPVQPGWRLVSWNESGQTVNAEFETPTGPRTVPCGRLVLAAGAGLTRMETLRPLKFHTVKGQLVRVRVPDAPDNLRPVSASGYVVPEGGTLVVGSSYEHEFQSPSPVRAVSRQLIARALPFLPWLEGATIDSEAAGVRVTVPETRLPMVGPLPNHRLTWVVGGLGSKGLLTAPVIAELLPAWLENPESVPSVLAVRTW